MSDDEADPELLELLRQTLGMGQKKKDELSADTGRGPQRSKLSNDSTSNGIVVKRCIGQDPCANECLEGVLKDAEYIYSNAIDVSIDMWGTKGAAASIYKSMQERNYSTEAWGQHDLHPTREEGFSDIDILNFVFTMDLLNFSFWSELDETARFQVDYQGKRWRGYKSLLACLRRALDEGVPITTPRFWNEESCSDEVLEKVFRSATDEQMPLLAERIAMLREVGESLHESCDDPDPMSNGGIVDEEPITSQDTNVNVVADATSSSVAPEMSESTSGGDVDTDGVLDADMKNLQLDDRPTPEQSGDSSQSRETEPTEEKIGRISTGLTGVPSDSEPLATPVKPDHSVVRLVEKAERSAGKLVNLLSIHFPSFRDEARFDGRRVRILKRAQIFVADLWAAMDGEGYGAFDDIGELTMFADYRVPQMLHSLGVLVYSPPLDRAIRTRQELPSGHSWELQLRGCSIWAVEMIRMEILRQHPEATNINAVLIDFFLYDLAKERETAEPVPHHRTRSIWY